MTTLLYPFLILAGVGFILSLLVHLLSLFGIELPKEIFVLHLGIFAVWLPTILISNFTHHRLHRHFGWKDNLLGCPRWMRLTTYSFFAYAFANFLLTLLGGAGTVSTTVRLFSGHWLAFYAMAFATLYSAIHQPHAQNPPASSQEFIDRP